MLPVLTLLGSRGTLAALPLGDIRTLPPINPHPEDIPVQTAASLRQTETRIWGTTSASELLRDKSRAADVAARCGDHGSQRPDDPPERTPLLPPPVRTPGAPDQEQPLPARHVPRGRPRSARHDA